MKWESTVYMMICPSCEAFYCSKPYPTQTPSSSAPKSMNRAPDALRNGVKKPTRYGKGKVDASSGGSGGSGWLQKPFESCEQHFISLHESRCKQTPMYDTVKPDIGRVITPARPLCCGSAAITPRLNLNTRCHCCHCCHCSKHIGCPRSPKTCPSPSASHVNSSSMVRACTILLV